MIAQMAQFSTVSGITQLNTTLTGISTQISENRIATAANFVGKTVLVPGNVAMPDDTGAISGAADTNDGYAFGQVDLLLPVERYATPDLTIDHARVRNDLAATITALRDYVRTRFVS